MSNSLPLNCAEAPLTVAALTDQIKCLLERPLKQIWVSGEISNFRRQSSGHCYFSIKDSNSQIPCVLFNRTAAQQSFVPNDGQAVILYGEINVFAPHGRYQLLVRYAVKSGAGHLQLEFERLKRLLAAEGLFDAARKQALPLLTRKIALITSESGAALQDFLRILKRRHYAGHIYLLHTSVQGPRALPEICKRLDQALTIPDLDLVVLTRGGGSAEDLNVFNQEALVRKIANYQRPTLSAIGHEIDTVLTDYAADQRAETPSAAAEMISSQWIKLRESFQQRVQQFQHAARQTYQKKIDAALLLSRQLDPRLATRYCELNALKLDSAENNLLQSAKAHNQLKLNTLNAHAQKLQVHHPATQIKLYQQSIEHSQGRLLRGLKNKQQSDRKRLHDLEKRLVNNSVQASLKRGYAIIRDAKGLVLERAKATSQEASVSIEFYDASVAAVLPKGSS